MEVESSASTMRTVVESVVRRPSPTIHQQKRKRSESPARSPPRRPRRVLPPSTLPDIDPERALERERQLQQRLAQQEKEDKKPFDAKEEYERLLNARSGGVYVPPARLRALQAQFTDKNTKEYQRMAWEALKKSINGLINKVKLPSPQIAA
jgi:pre-mRNA-splicing factor CWC22